MKCRKPAALLLVLLLLVSLVPTALAADGSRSFEISLNADRTGELETGDTVKITCSLKRTDLSESWQMYAWQTEIAFDNAAFELVDGSVEAAEGVGSSVHPGALMDKVYFNDFSLSPEGDEYPAILEAGSFTLRVKDAGDGTYTVRSTNSRVSTQGGREACALKAADVTLTLAGTGMRPSERFGDVPAGAWYSDAVDFVVRRGLFSGTGEDTFSPEANMTRAMLVTVLWRWEGKPQTDAENRFRDVKSGAWYTDAVRWASAQGIVTGYDEQTFGPDDSVTRQQMAAILCRWAGSRGYATGESGELSGYRDKDEIAPWALTAMGWACGAGLITGRTADTLSPNGTATRAEVATVFTRLCRIITGGQI